jgi:hypothetical protein
VKLTDDDRSGLEEARSVKSMSRETEVENLAEEEENGAVNQRRRQGRGEDKATEILRR